MWKAIQQTQRETHYAEKNQVAEFELVTIYRSHLEIGIFPISFSGRRPIVLPRPFRQTERVKMKSPLRLDPADRLIVLRRLDRFRKWQSLDDRRFCRCCHKTISGRQVEVIDVTAPDEDWHLACPTTDCPSNVEDWVYPDEIAQPPDKWGRRSFAWLIRMGKDSSSAESSTVIPAAAFPSDSRLVQGRPPDAHAPHI